LQERLIQISTQFLLRLDAFEAAAAKKVDRLEGQLTLALGHMAELQAVPRISDGTDCFRELSRGIKSIKELT
jgi:sensor c-di-GMP phosphodiesterase-like protein